MLPRNCALFLFATIAFLHAPLASAQEPAETAEQPVTIAAPINVEQGPEDALNRGTPRGSAVGFMQACADFDFEKAAQYLDLRNLPSDIEDVGGHELARQLNHVLSRSVWLDDYNVSDSPEGFKGDDLPSYRDLLVTVRTREGVEYPIWIQRVPRGDGEKIWKISNRSVAFIPEMYDAFSYSPAVERVRQWFPESASFLGLEAFKWFILAVVGLLAWPVFWLIGLGLSRVISSPDKPTYPLWRRALTGPTVLIAILILLGFVVEGLGAGAYAQMVMDANTLPVVAVVWAIWVFISLIKTHKQTKLIDAGRPGAAKLMQPMSTLLKVLVLLFGLLFWLSNLGVNITTVIAGLGVGGLAVALALQKPIEDMMGALSIFSQAPFRVGDLVKYKNVLGAVEDIGLRTTRIRTLTNTVVSIPNAHIAYLEVENLSYRTKIRYWPTLRLRYDTRPEQLKAICEGILEALKSHEQVHDEPMRVRFTDFDRDAVLLKVHAFMKTTDFAESLQIGEELNYGIMQIVEDAGARFALPGASIQIEGGETLSRS
jgi:MscS family membrane protein